MKDACHHCHLPLNHNNRVHISINGTLQDFCCTGCASVCQTIYEAGLGAFYKQQTNTLLPAVELQYPLEFYDNEAFQQPFLKASEAGTQSITLVSDTIHCAACA